MPKPGQVVRIRVSPTDCLGILDILDKARVPRQNISFSQCASLALGTLIEFARKAELIPRPDGFDFMNRMEPYIGNSHRGRREGAADLLYQDAPEFSSAATPKQPDSMTLEEAIKFCEIIQGKKDQGEKLTQEENTKYEEAVGIVYRDAK